MRRLRRTLLLGWLLATFGIASQAACDTGLAERMHAKLHPKRALDHERAVCEPWRGVPGRFIVVLPLPRPASEPGTTGFDLDVLLVQQADNGNTERAKVVSRLFEEEALTEDAVRIGEIRVDGARYTLAPDARAFGLRILRQGSSRANPYSNETLTLYVPQGPKLAKVLDRLELTLEQGEWDTNCTGSFETVRGSLSVARASSSGYADLILRQARSDSRSSPLGDECVTQERPQAFKSRLLRFDGTRYRLAKGAAPD
ncbi:hypothetical protein AB4Z46_06395 [Variovorax sp. M-6]|uniref:hypothetical protein n=1 Tax=Variovorax sp. M-6 TaxID=3233041 RepID=UPI003F9AB145